MTVGRPNCSHPRTAEIPQTTAAATPEPMLPRGAPCGRSSSDIMAGLLAIMVITHKGESLTRHHLPESECCKLLDHRPPYSFLCEWRIGGIEHRLRTTDVFQRSVSQ